MAIKFDLIVLASVFKKVFALKYFNIASNMLIHSIFFTLIILIFWLFNSFLTSFIFIIDEFFLSVLVFSRLFHISFHLLPNFIF
jgi:hypothetical protein